MKNLPIIYLLIFQLQNKFNLIFQLTIAFSKIAINHVNKLLVINYFSFLAIQQVKIN